MHSFLRRIYSLIWEDVRLMCVSALVDGNTCRKPFKWHRDTVLYNPKKTWLYSTIREETYIKITACIYQCRNCRFGACIYQCRNCRSEISGESHPFVGEVQLMPIKPQPWRGESVHISIQSSGIRGKDEDDETRRERAAPTANHHPSPSLGSPHSPPLNRRPSLPSRRRPRRGSRGSTTRPAPPSKASRSNRRCSQPICCR